jgi:hypothetical protein
VLLIKTSAFCWNNNCVRTWVVLDASKSSTNFTKDVNNETPTLNPEPREKSLDRGSENYFYHRLLLSAHYFIWAQFNNRTSFDVLPTTNISFIFLHVSVENKTPTEVKLIMKTGPTAN